MPGSVANHYESVVVLGQAIVERQGRRAVDPGRVNHSHPHQSEGRGEVV